MEIGVYDHESLLREKYERLKCRNSRISYAVAM